jgi:hypothetical protein
MLESDSTKPVPSTAELTQFWKEVNFPLSARVYPSVQRYVEALRERYSNGRVLFASFQCPNHPVFDWYLSRNDPQNLLFFHRFWHMPTPSSILAELKVPKEYENDPPFQWGNSFTFAGELASRLYQGGAYYRLAGSGAEEMRLGERSAHELIQDRFSEILVFMNHASWTEFFFDVAWDGTWVLFDKREKVVHVLTGTDTD